VASRLDRWISRTCYRALMAFHKPLTYADYYRRAARHARAGGFSVLHAHDLNTLPAAVLAARGRDTRIVFDAHELYPEVSTLSARERRVWRFVERRLIRRPDAVVTVCESIAEHLRERYAIAKPAILHNCPPRTARPVAVDSTLLRRRAGLEDRDDPIVLYQGGLTPNRGLEELVRAARYLERGVLVLMGDGRLRPALEELVARLALHDRVRLIPAVPQAALLAHTAGADVGVIPYKAVGLNNTYSTPNKLFEYMAAGLPVAGSRLPELCRFIEGYELGVTFDPERPDDIGMALNYLLGPAVSRAALAANARAAAERYVWEDEVAKLVAIHAGPELAA
jgi:glycosyltransferase involved in cell wall biosynthesis